MNKLDYLAHRRRMVALDEWGWYAVLGATLFGGIEHHWAWLILFFIILIYGAVCVILGYKGYWELEKKWLSEFRNSSNRGL